MTELLKLSSFIFNVPFNTEQLEEEKNEGKKKGF